ncbi:MAG: tRNA 2-thiouridine(34) synthase MnmA [Acidimicrobiia bacterium]|nr:tRNA 2-thiouridine(34) synthase MnmA [Acidimicrobiia bacterium]
MRVLAAMSGGVDSSVAAALLLEAGHDVVGVTMRLWEGDVEGTCCSVAEIDDARRVAQQLGIDHWVFRFTDDFETRVVEPYAAAHAAGLTPNPCIECNRHVKFDRLLRRASQLGFDAVATGHHARIRRCGDRFRLLRGADPAKDQSYVLYVLGQPQLGRCLFPVGEITKAEVRARAADLGLRTATKPDSVEVCFVTASGGREDLLRSRVGLRPGRVVDTCGAVVGHVDATELVTVGQRRGLGIGGGARRYALSVDPVGGTVVVGDLAELMDEGVVLSDVAWVDRPRRGPVMAQCSAHGVPVAADIDGNAVRFAQPHRRVAPGQSVVLYAGDEVLGGGIAS